MLTVFFHPAWYFILFKKFLIALSFTSEGVEWAQERKQIELVFSFCAFSEREDTLYLILIVLNFFQ